ncbi:M48 family metallopeptidase [Geminocystis sp. GBBB08]|uniref:M48 family metallopeptidase n=1 Tax=Geminocystis sp. GBBB08 TaxID=2604140 RepID=UPI0027E29865|nr:M48 family metallopeptidase [Geminocystis sp. GBBB08]MBL1208230.1 M48 family metallopeptidase [Geminocystis sp. GBBB08]
MNRKKIPLLNIEDYEHPWDKSARDSLEKVPGFTGLIKKLNEIGFDRLLKIQFTGSSFKVNQSNLSDVYKLLQEACDILAIDRQPDLYIQMGYGINAFTAGVEKPIVVLNRDCIDWLSSDELLYVIAHELGHIKSNHVLYYQTASYLPSIAQVMGNTVFGLGSLFTTGLQLSLMNWKRMSEFTADRAGLLACQNPEVAASVMVKLAGLPKKYFTDNLVQDFLKQAQEFESYDYDTIDRIAKIFSTINNSHPWIVMRTAELFKWFESPDYSKVMAKSHWKSALASDSELENISDVTKPWHY